MTKVPPKSTPVRRWAAILIVVFDGVIGISLLWFQWWRSERLLESTGREAALKIQVIDGSE